ncbi:Na+/H+ antiporter subunit E [Candidatus Xianfuyuplasma coldseepsis]|uniref:Na+/H+ antiporter subunit E n=1 Tax=Candidatus Xianfuyuplasma coldseepsis TaxID=2782163 RepID=A0A7L7KQF2_9MOLU|nr:Na+/H+ antiporter subunit E [Xianfuyuplasma coldseepsis]QMS84659.1 Na+/H+ antiporter subunit E [Xianfuyuplasma coldseepsis]
MMWSYIKLRYKLFVVLLLFWFLLQLNVRLETILLGVLVSAFITVSSYNVLYDEQGYRYHGIRFGALVRYIVMLFIEIYRAGFRYITNLLFRHYEPVVFTMHLDVDDPVLLSIIANSITLTPGTISIEVDTIHYMITVMTMAKKGTSIKELEQPIHDKFEKLLKPKEGSNV